MAEGFAVDTAALRAAAQGVRATVEQVAVGAAEPVGAAAGHDGLAAALDGFVERRRHGMTVLVEDGRAVAEHLDADLAAYQAIDEAGRQGITVLRGPGPDPAAD